MNDISPQYGDSVIVQFSGDGLAALAEGGKFMSAMETVTKYGLNGSVSDSGKVIYNVQEGQVHP